MEPMAVDEMNAKNLVKKTALTTDDPLATFPSAQAFTTGTEASSEQRAPVG